MSGVGPLVLASASPQRRAILERLGVSFTVRATDVEEIEQGEPEQVAVENALLKARAAHTAGSAGDGARRRHAGGARYSYLRQAGG